MQAGWFRDMQKALELKRKDRTRIKADAERTPEEWRDMVKAGKIKEGGE